MEYFVIKFNDMHNESENRKKKIKLKSVCDNWSQYVFKHIDEIFSCQIRR